jgi:prepilin-type processing-associated H-X9-DG protein
MRNLKMTVTGLAIAVLILAAGMGCRDDKSKTAETAPTPRNPGDTSGYYGAIAGAKERAASVACLSNLGGIGIALTQYALQNDGKFPPSLKTLADSGVISATSLRCPDPPKPEYVYVPGLTQNSSPGAVIVYDPEPHNNQINVLYVDGSAKSIAKEQFQKP